MFLILAYFSYFVFTRENSSASLAAGNRKSRRNRAYRVLGVIIFASVLALGVKAAALEFVLDPATAENFGKWWDGLRLTFWFEALGLVAFGLSWMIKGRFLKYYEDEAALS